MSLKRNVENEMSFDGTCLVHPDFAVGPTTKDRKTVMGLFDEPAEDPNYSEDGSAGPDDSSAHLDPESSWTEGYDRSPWSSVGHLGLSPLHFFSPSTQGLRELSPLGKRPSLRTEVGNDEEWGLNTRNYHLRTSSLYDMSQVTAAISASSSLHFQPSAFG